MCCWDLQPARRAAPDICRPGRRASHGKNSAGHRRRVSRASSTRADGRTARRSNPAAPAGRETAPSFRRVSAPPWSAVRSAPTTPRSAASNAARARPSACHARLQSINRSLVGLASVGPLDSISRGTLRTEVRKFVRFSFVFFASFAVSNPDPNLVLFVVLVLYYVVKAPCLSPWLSPALYSGTLSLSLSKSITISQP